MYSGCGHSTSSIIPHAGLERIEVYGHSGGVPPAIAAVKQVPPVYSLHSKQRFLPIVLIVSAQVAEVAQGVKLAGVAIDVQCLFAPRQCGQTIPCASHSSTVHAARAHVSETSAATPSTTSLTVMPLHMQVPATY